MQPAVFTAVEARATCTTLAVASTTLMRTVLATQLARTPALGWRLVRVGQNLAPAQVRRAGLAAGGSFGLLPGVLSAYRAWRRQCHPDCKALQARSGCGGKGGRGRASERSTNCVSSDEAHVDSAVAHSSNSGLPLVGLLAPRLLSRGASRVAHLAVAAALGALRRFRVCRQAVVWVLWQEADLGVFQAERKNERLVRSFLWGPAAGGGWGGGGATLQLCFAVLHRRRCLAIKSIRKRKAGCSERATSGAFAHAHIKP